MFGTINERVKHVLDTLYKGNVTAMSKTTCIKRTTLSSIICADGNKPGFDVIKKIADITSPRISMEWLVRGVGDMFLDEKDSLKYQINSGTNISNSPVNDSETLNRLLALIETKDKQIEEKDKQINSLLEVLKNTKVG